MPGSIIFNGRAYESRAVMPDEIRSLYDQSMALFEDADQDGIPDLFEGVSASSIVVDGQAYANLAEMPGNVRSVCDRAMGRFRSSSTDTWPQDVDSETRIEVNAVQHSAAGRPSPSTRSSRRSLDLADPNDIRIPRGLVVVLIVVGLLGLLGVLATIVFMVMQ